MKKTTPADGIAFGLRWAATHPKPTMQEARYVPPSTCAEHILQLLEIHGPQRLYQLVAGIGELYYPDTIKTTLQHLRLRGAIKLSRPSMEWSLA